MKREFGEITIEKIENGFLIDLEWKETTDDDFNYVHEKYVYATTEETSAKVKEILDNLK